jgi:mannose-6-phosphate isomerase-like protein (cupin superfamily)
VFSKKNLSQIPIEQTMHTAGSRKMIVAPEETGSPYFEAMTYGYLESGKKWDMHQHDDIVEICLVIKGQGLIKNENGQIESFSSGDRFIFPANTEHEIENTGQITAEFYFIRIRTEL